MKHMSASITDVSCRTLLGATTAMVALLVALVSPKALAVDQSPYYSNLFALKNTMKSKGCVFDALTTDSDTTGQVALVNRSQCQYLHRAIETWASPPDFEKARHVLSQVTKPGMIYGMFIAEAISTTASYYYPAENRNFQFSQMCRPGTVGQWGPNTCIPSYASPEYQKYLIYIATRALDLGIQDFAFGQVYLCEDMSNPALPSLMNQIRMIAAARGQSALMGGQTNDMTTETYLQSFDYIFGGVGERADQPAGFLESGPCASKYSGFCWALLWNPTFASKANDVLINFDWSNSPDDDMSIFAAMNSSDRAQALSSYYNAFLGKNMGFMLPYSAPLAGSVLTGCYGSNVYVYSPDNKYACQDEAAISNAIGVREADLSTCSANTDCASNICLDGYCGFKPNGWGCASDDACASHYCSQPPPISTGGTCTARKADLSSCSSHRECASNVCLEGFCGLKPNGWGCASDSVCASYYCSPSSSTETGGTCAARKADLSPCTSDNQCTSFVCLAGYCGLKPGGWGCWSDSVCASHVCVNGVCQ